MRWLFLLLLVLNGCYLVWNLQDAPAKAKDIGTLAQVRGGNSGLQLVSESDKLSGAAQNCVYVGGYTQVQALAPVSQQLRVANVPFAGYSTAGPSGKEYWLRIPRPDAASIPSLAEVTKQFKDLKQQIILCEGIATPEQFE
jgi:hypothetical protein